MKRKHVELIKAWADGAEIEYKDTVFPDRGWNFVKSPSWEDHIEYRIKPEPVKVVRYLVIGDSFTLYGYSENQNANLRLTLIDGKLVEAEVLKNGN
jgi:hypothetical protein